MITADQYKNLPEEAKALYNISGEGYALKPADKPDTSEYDSRIAKLEKVAEDRAAQLKQFEGLDPDRARQLIAAADSQEYDKLLKDGELEEIRSRARAPLEELITKQAAQLEQMIQAGKTNWADTQIEKGISGKGITAEHAGLVRDSIQLKMVVDGEPGSYGLTIKDGEHVKTLDAYLDGLVESNPLLQGKMCSGDLQGSRSTNTTEPPPSVTRAELKKTLGASSAFIQEHGIEAYRNLK